MLYFNSVSLVIYPIIIIIVIDILKEKINYIDVVIPIHNVQLCIKIYIYYHICQFFI